MHPYCVYVFDSTTANEAAVAVEKGQYDNIIQYHSNKHQNMTNKPMPPHHQGPPLPPPQSMQGPPPPSQQQPPHNMMGGPPSYPGPPPPPPHHHVSPPNHMQPHSMGPGGPPPMQPPPPATMQQQPYDPNLSPQKVKERETKLIRIGQLAQVSTQLPPPTMHQMTSMNPASQRLGSGQVPPAQQTQPPQQRPRPQQQQQPPLSSQQQSVKQEQQHLDPLQSMAAMSECPNMDGYGHTIHHHPPS